MCGECIVDSWHLWFCVYTYQKAVVIITWGTEATSGQVMWDRMKDFKHFDARDWLKRDPSVGVGHNEARLSLWRCVCVLFIRTHVWHNSGMRCGRARPAPHLDGAHLMTLRCCTSAVTVMPMRGGRKV